MLLLSRRFYVLLFAYCVVPKFAYCAHFEASQISKPKKPPVSFPNLQSKQRKALLLIVRGKLTAAKPTLYDLMAMLSIEGVFHSLS